MGLLLMRVKSCEILLLMRELMILKMRLLKLIAMTIKMTVLTVKLTVLTAKLAILRKVRIMRLVTIEPLLQAPIKTLLTLIPLMLFKLIVLTFFLLCVKQRLLREIV